MNRDQQRFYDEYVLALNGYLAGEGEAALTRAYELGRRAVAGGLGVLDVAEFHNRAMLSLLRLPESDSQLVRWLNLNGDFLREALSAYEVTHLGFREATDLLRHTWQFATVMCHELRTPLTSILASATMLQEQLDPEPGSVEGRLLANILAGATKLKARSDSLDEIVGLEVGSLTLNLLPVDVRALITETCQHYEPQLAQVGLDLVARLPEELPTIIADRERLEQVLCNLVDNAIKYGSDGKAIHVTAGLVDASLVIEVQDFGHGIPIWDRPKLFQEHFRAERDRHRVPGLGIGLALCNAIITAHSGKIWVESEEGKGTTFKFSLPLSTRAMDL